MRVRRSPVLPNTRLGISPGCSLAPEAVAESDIPAAAVEERKLLRRIVIPYACGYCIAYQRLHAGTRAGWRRLRIPAGVRPGLWPLEAGTGDCRTGEARLLSELSHNFPQRYFGR